MKGTLMRHFQVQIGGKVSMVPFLLPKPSSDNSFSSTSRFQDLLDSDAAADTHLLFPSSSHRDGTDFDSNAEDKDFILSQDFFCTPDYITPDDQHILNGLD